MSYGYYEAISRALLAYYPYFERKKEINKIK
jgi:hypothetical protein